MYKNCIFLMSFLFYFSLSAQETLFQTFLEKHPEYYEDELIEKEFETIHTILLDNVEVSSQKIFEILHTETSQKSLYEKSKQFGVALLKGLVFDHSAFFLHYFLGMIYESPESLNENRLQQFFSALSESSQLFIDINYDKALLSGLTYVSFDMLKKDTVPYWVVLGIYYLKMIAMSTLFYNVKETDWFRDKVLSHELPEWYSTHLYNAEFTRELDCFYTTLSINVGFHLGVFALLYLASCYSYDFNHEKLLQKYERIISFIMTQEVS